jgi:hypothetical protein
MMSEDAIGRRVQILGLTAAVLVAGSAAAQVQVIGSSGADLFLLPKDIESRAISFENPTGGKGIGGQAASNLGPGRKGAAFRMISKGETIQLCDIEGPGVIRHVWMTFRKRPDRLRGMVVRAYWEGQKHPSIESPIGDLMGFAHGMVMPYQSAVHSVGENAGMNLWLPMPFSKRARITLTNETEEDIRTYYQIDYTLNDEIPEDSGRLHVSFRRENLTTLKQDFEILPKRTGRGRWIGCVLGVRVIDTKHWWGEGEVKFYMDGDTEWPTICGTGSEDYVALSYGMQQTPFQYHGCSLKKDPYVSMYRWHLPDPIYWQKDCRITIQQMGIRRDPTSEVGWAYFDRQDDWSAAAFWYEPVPSAPLPAMPDFTARTADIVVAED